MDNFKKSLPLLWKPQEKIKFWFIQEPWIYFLVKSRNCEIFYITNIMTFSKFAQKNTFTCYLLVCILFEVNQIFSFIHSFISCRPSCPDEWFQFKLFLRKYNDKLHFRIWLFLLVIVLRCWNLVEYIQKIIISFLAVPFDEINCGVRHIKLCKI